MIGVTFRKNMAEQFLNCLNNQMALEVPTENWTADNLLELAGACLCVVVSQGPRFLEAQGVDHSQLQDEQREAVESSILPETNWAIEWNAMRCFEILGGEYDERFEPMHNLMMTVDGEKLTVAAVKGFKDFDPVEDDDDDGESCKNAGQ